MKKKTPGKKRVSAKKVHAEIVDDSEDLPKEDLPKEDLQLLEKLPFVPPTPVVSLKNALVPKSDSSAATLDPIATYLREIQKYPLLTRDQEQELAKKFFDQKDSEAAHTLVTSNLRFVVKIAVEYSKFGARLIDLVQEGNMGLMHAVRDFNPYKGNRLITYAVWWIRGYIQEYLMKQFSLVKIGTTQSQKKLFYRLQREKELLENLSHPDDIKRLSLELGVSPEDLVSMGQRLSGRDVSLNQPVGNDSPTQLQDLQASKNENIEDALAHREELDLLKTRIDEIRPKLNERENILLEERLLSDEPLTLQEIGTKYGITREAVRQTEARLLQKIRALF